MDMKMIDNLSLSASEQLCAFLDGELEPTEASSLFFALAQSTDLQEEMREHIGIKKLLGKTMLKPPDSLKMSIMQGAGLFDAAAPLNTTIDGTGGKGFWMPLLKNRGFLVLSSAIIACLATLFYTNHHGIQDSGSYAGIIANEAAAMTGNPKQNSNLNVILPQAKHKLPIVSSVAKDNELRTAKVVTTSSSVKDRNHNLNSSLAQSNNSINDNNFINPPQNIESLGNPISNQKNFQTFSPKAFGTNSQTYIYNSIYPDIKASSFLDDEILRRLSLQIRGFTARSIPENEVAPLAYPALNNMGISLFYQLDENNSWGLEIGQENLLQKFSGIIDEKPSIVDQNWLAFWWGFTYQYTMKNEDEFADLRPFVRLFVGDTRVGPIGRTILGLQYTIADRMNVFGGIEGSVLYYDFQGTIFTTKKIGLTYGFGVKF